MMLGFCARFVDHSVGLHAVTADELVEETVFQCLAQDCPAGAVAIVEDHERVRAALGEFRQVEAIGCLAFLVRGELGDITAELIDIFGLERVGEAGAVVVVEVGNGDLAVAHLLHGAANAQSKIHL